MNEISLRLMSKQYKNKQTNKLCKLMWKILSLNTFPDKNSGPKDKMLDNLKFW